MIGGFKNPVLTGSTTVSMSVDFISSTQSVEFGGTVSFSNLSNPTPLFNFWDFGDGSFSTASNPDKVYTTPGTFSVSLSAMDITSGGIETKTNYIFIEEPNLSPLILFDITNGSYPGSGNTLTNLAPSGSTYNATLFNNPTYTTNQSINFNGTNQYGTIAGTQELMVGNLFYTINAWFRYSDITGWRTILGQNRPLTLGQFYFQKSNASETDSFGTVRLANRFSMNVPNTSNNSPLTQRFFPDNNYVPNTNDWNFYSFTYDGVNGKLYRQGVLVFSAPYTTGFPVNPTSPINIAAGFFSGSRVDYFSGSINYISIYNQALTDSEILSIFNSTKGRFGL